MVISLLAQCRTLDFANFSYRPRPLRRRLATLQTFVAGSFDFQMSVKAGSAGGFADAASARHH